MEHRTSLFYQMPVARALAAPLANPTAIRRGDAFLGLESENCGARFEFVDGKEDKDQREQGGRRRGERRMRNWMRTKSRLLDVSNCVDWMDAAVAP